jgi:hypothetical protein
MKTNQKKSPKDRKVKLRDLRARKNVKGGFNPQPDPPRR